MKEVKNLADIRDAIDEIDTKIIELLKERSEYIPFVKEIKKNLEAKIAFAREGQMGHNLMQRDFGNYNKLYMQRIWRELIMATLFIEGPFNIAILKTNNIDAYIKLREISLAQFSFNTKINAFENTEDALKSVLANHATVAVFPYNKNENNESSKWWVTLYKNESYNSIKLTLTLPFLPTAYNSNTDVVGFCCSKGKIEPTGFDVSFFVIEDSKIESIKESYTVVDKHKTLNLIAINGFAKEKTNCFFIGTSVLPVKAK